jgi:ribulose-phosphate 3-epimerase
MNASIVPTIDAETADTYNQQIYNVAGFATRIHIDIADGVMTPMPLVPITDVWWPGGVRADIHVMYKAPMAHLEMLVNLGPQLIVLHAEGEGSFADASHYLRAHGVEAGVAIMQQTPVSYIAPGLEWVDHVLIYSGSLGTFGGKADLDLLDKVRELKRLKPTLEIGWDGGVNDQNAAQLAVGGVDVLNTGGYIQRAANPQAAYDTLKTIIASING